MPVIKSAIKKLRKDRKRTVVNKRKRDTVKEVVKKAKIKPMAENVRRAQSLIDKAAKTHLIHKNKAARLKSKLAKLLGKKTFKRPSAKKMKTTPTVKKSTKSVKSGL